jgi:hypothetical protein
MSASLHSAPPFTASPAFPFSPDQSTQPNKPANRVNRRKGAIHETRRRASPFCPAFVRVHTRESIACTRNIGFLNNFGRPRLYRRLRRCIGNAIPDTAYNYELLGKCSPAGVDYYGHATTAKMVAPGVVYNGTESTSTSFVGSATDPIPLVAFPITWNATVTLTEPSSDALPTLHVSGSLTATCYPEQEISVGATDVAELPTPNPASIAYIGGCLTGISKTKVAINSNIPLSPIPH